MSATAQRYFKKTATLVAMLQEAQEREFTTGIPRNRISGAGKHLRWINPEVQLKTELKRFSSVCVTIGLPSNVGWGKVKPNVNDIRKGTGWIEACKEYKPAMVVLGALYRLHTNRGALSPYHAGGEDIAWLFDIWESPRFITSKQARGLTWLVKASQRVVSKDGQWPRQVVPSIVGRLGGRKLLERVGALTPLARWAICSKLPTKGQLTHRDLDWAFLASLKRSQRLAIVPEELRVSLLWNEVGINCPKGTTVMPNEIATSSFKKLSDYMQVDYKRDKEVFDAALRLVFMFGKDVDAVIKYVETHLTTAHTPEYYKQNSCERSRVRARILPVHDMAQKLPLGKSLPGWKGFVLSHLGHKDFAVVMDNMAAVEDIMGGKVPKSVAELRRVMTTKCLQWFVSSLNEFEKMFVKNNPAKSFEMCPHIDIERNGYVIKKLSYNDTEQVNAGRLVDCCQHLTGIGADCAVKAWTSGYCAIYAVYKDERMVAQSFAWRAENGALVFDSLECLGGADRSAVCEMFSLAAKGMVGRLGVKKILVGNTSYGVTREFIQSYTDGKEMSTPSKGFSLSYSDANHGCYTVVKAEIKLPKRTAKVEYIDNAKHEDFIVNELSEDSDVFCEHCEVEVHVTCQVCPVCHEDIAEWV